MKSRNKQLAIESLTLWYFSQQKKQSFWGHIKNKQGDVKTEIHRKTCISMHTYLHIPRKRQTETEGDITTQINTEGDSGKYSEKQPERHLEENGLREMEIQRNRSTQRHSETIDTQRVTERYTAERKTEGMCVRGVRERKRQREKGERHREEHQKETKGETHKVKYRRIENWRERERKQKTHSHTKIY